MATMIGLFSTVGAHVPFFKKDKMLKVKPESLVSRMSYRATTTIILCFMVLVTCPEWISGGTGVNIDCMHGNSIPDAVINNYCYIAVSPPSPHPAHLSPGHLHSSSPCDRH